jgi:hypothetical protein
MTRHVTLHVDEFGQHALERFSRDGKGSPANAIRMAALYYLADRDAERPAWRAPHLPPGSEPGRSLPVELDEEIWRALSTEAAQQGVEPEVLALHAVLYLLADIDSGRVAGMLEDALDGAD